MGYLTNFFKNKFNLSKIPLNQIIKTNNMANAYQSGNYDRIEKLLRKGKYYYKSIKFKENNDYSLLHQSILDSNKNVIDIILSQSYTKEKDIIEDIENDLGFAPIHLACIKDDVDMIKDLIAKGGSSIEIKTKSDNLNLLHISAQFGSLKTFEYMYKNFYYKNIDTLTDEKWSPFHFATFMNKFDICSFLIDNRADMYLRNKQYLTPLETATLNDNFELFYALYNFNYSKEVLNSFDHPESAKPIHIAASCKKGTRILEYLLEDVNNLNDICNSHIKATPLHFACMQNNSNGVKCILRRNPNLNMTDYLGNTPLHYATENGNLDILRSLCDYGADALKKNKEGLNSLQIAIHQNNKEVKLFFLGLERYKYLESKDFI